MNLRRIITTTVAGGVAGSIIFWLYQISFQGNSITAFIGAQIVRQGGYALPPGLVGWGVHLGVSLSYALLLALLMAVPFSPSAVRRRGTGLAAALILGWATNKIAPPAIQVTIGVLSGKGFISPTWPLNPSWNHPFYNHVLFFVAVWLIDWGISGLLARQGAARA